MIDLKDFRLAKDLYAHLDGIGVSGSAADAIKKETAEYRHAWRTCRAEEAALAWARKLWRETFGAAFLDSDDPPRAITECLRAAAGMLCRLDAFGIGGKDGVEGGATLRVQAFQNLGKGRKNASDGPAWSAAIAAAGWRLGRGVCFFPAGPSMIGYKSEGEDPPVGLALTAEQIKKAGITPWLLTVAREGLRKSLGLEGWLLPFGSTLVAEDYEAKAWADLVNALEDQEETETEGETEGEMPSTLLSMMIFPSLRDC